MGSSIGCVRPPREGDLGAPTLSPKKRLRFRRKHKGRKNRKRELEQEGVEQQRSQEPHEREVGDEDEEEKAAVIESADLSKSARTLKTVPDTELTHSKTHLHSNTLSPGSVSASFGGRLNNRILESSPKPSPAWRGVFCLPGEEDTVSAIIDVSSIPSQTTTTTPVYTAPTLGSTTPGGGRVCRVKEKVQGVLEKPWILRQKKEKKDKGKVDSVEKKDRRAKGGPEKTEAVVRTPSGREHKGVVHIREVDGKLCVVRTVYPSDFGSPVWSGVSDSEVEVRKEPLAPSPVTGNILKVQLSEEEKSKGNIFAGDFTMSSNQMWIQDTLTVKGFSLHPQVQEHCSLLESGYSSDLPVTSPETAGTTPSQTDWGGLTSSSSERLDSMLESPLQQATVKYLPQISEIYVSGESADLTAKEKLLLWSKQATEGYPGLRCTNFTTSWSDGRMFNALLHRYRPDLIDMEVVSRQSNLENLEQAFEIAESLGVTSLLDAEDVDVPSPDEKSVITYVSSIYDAFPKIPEGGEGITAHEVDQRWSEYQSRFFSLLQWSRQHTAIMANKNFPQNPVELKALYNEYVHFKETEIPAKEVEKGHTEHLYKLLEVWIEFGRIKLPQGLHPNDLEEEWGKLILEMLEREKALRPAVERLEHLLQRANKIQNMALDCEEKLTLARNTLQADMSRVESGEGVQCERELACYLQDCESLIRQLNQELKVLREEKYYQVEQLVFRASCLQEELVSLRLQCSSLYRKGNFTQSLGPTGAEQQRASDGGLTLGQTLLGAVGAVGAALLRRPIARSQLVAMSSSEDEGSLRFIYELLGWVEETQELLERAEWGADLPSVENNLQEHNTIHTAVEELMSSLQEARSYEAKVSPNFKSSYSETLAKLEHQYCKLLEHSSWRLRSLESLHAFVSHCTEELIWLNEREEEEIAFDWSDNNSNMNAKRELYSEMRLELDEKQDVMRSLQETANRLCQENHPAKQSVEAYSAALQTQWQWVKQLCVCVETHLKDNTAYFQFTSDARDCESYLRQLQETIKRQYTCDKNSRLSKLEDLLQDSMEEKEQLIEYRSTVASLVGRAKTLVQLRPRNAESTLGATTPIRAVCDYRQIEITITRGEECVLEDNSQRTKWKVISTTGNEAMVPSVCFTVPPPNQEAMDTASRAEQLYQKVMSLWHQLHVNMKSVVSWHYLLKDIRTVSGWNLDTVRCQSPSERQQVLDHLESQMSDFLSDSKESILFTAGERRELEKEVQQAQTHCQDLLLNMETVEKDESVSRSYLSELQNITLRLNDAEQKLMRGIQTPPPSRLSGDCGDNTVQIAEQENLQSELDAMRSSLGDVSRRCISFFEEKPTSSSIPVLRAELNQAVEKTDRLHNLSSVYLEKLKTVEVLMRSLDEAESQVRKNESRLSEEDIVPADTTAIKNLREQLGKWQSNLVDQEGVFQSLQSEVACAKEAASQLSKLHPDRSPELERLQERANQMADRWSGVKRQMDTRRTDLESVGSALQQYRDGHSALINWIEETTKRQENTQPGQTDSKALSEQLAQQTALVAEIEQNQTKLDECQTHSKQYCTSVKDYELQLMTYRAFVESTQKSPVKRRRMHSSSDAITHEFMDLRTRYTALVTLTTQHVKYISDALRRIEEEEKEVEEEKQARVGQVSDLLGFVKGLQGRTGGPNAESSLAAQQAISEQLAAKKDEVAEAIRSTQIFLLSKQASKLSPEECAHVEAQLDELTSTYNQLCTSSTQQLQQLEQQLAKEEERKSSGGFSVSAVIGVIMKSGMPNANNQLLTCRASLCRVISWPINVCATGQALTNQSAIAGVIDLGTVETFPVFKAAQRGLIDQDTCHVLLEAQLIMGGLLKPDSPLNLSLEQGLAQGLIDTHYRQSLSELETALLLVGNTKSTDDRTQIVLPVATAIEFGLIREDVGLRILELQLNTGGLRNSVGDLMSLEQADEKRLLTSRTLSKLQSRQHNKELIDPNTAEQLNLNELQQRCVCDDHPGLLLLPVKQQPGGTVCLQTGRKVGIFRAVQEGLIDRKVTVRLLEAQLLAGGISDPRSGHRMTIDEAVRHGLMDQDLACAMLARQLQNGGILDPYNGERLSLEESIHRDLLSPRLALLVLESLWAFMGILRPESGEILPIVEAIQQGVISGELSRNILRKRHAIGALYNPENLKVLPLNQAAEEALEPSVVSFLKDIHIPDVLSSMKQSGTPSLNRLSWGSTSSSPPPSSPTPSTSPSGVYLETALKHGMNPEEHAKQKLLLHLMTHSYVDALSGNRLVLLDPELVELVKATQLVAGDSVYESTVKPQSTLTTDETGKLQMETGEMEGEDAELAKLVLQLKQGGLMTEEGEKLLPDEAVAQGVLPGHTAVKLMAQAGLFGGFLDASSCESLSMDDVMQEGLLDEDLMWSVLKSDKTLSGVVDVEKRQICGVSEAAQVGLIDPNTAARLLEAQVVSGGIVDLRRDKKVSVTLAAKLGLIEEGQREELVALEKAYKGKDSDSTKTLTKASLQLQMEGIIDPESKSPVPLEQAIQKGLIRSEDVYQVLARQVAEGGVIHHASGVRLSVPDAVDRGLVDRSIAPGLEELEWVYQGKVSPSSHPEAVLFQASTGAILDPESGCKLTLTEAVSMGLLDENIASETMASPAVAQGVLDPKTARIVPYSELVKQGKIDIETGKRFLEVKPFRGVPDEETGDSLTLPEAVASKKVDPVPALRLLQSQADSGGIIDIRTGDRLPLYEAFERGLIEDSMVRTIATNQFLKGGLVDPATGQRVSSLNEAIAKRLIPNDVASEIQERLASFALKEKADMKEESKREGQKENVENRVSVSQQPEQPESSQEVKKGKEQELPQKSTLPNNEKAALLMKAKESILKKVFEKGVSEKQAAEELQALRKEVGSQGKTVKSQTQPTKADLVESHGVGDDGVKRTNGSPNESAEEKMITEDKTVENIFGKENTQLCEASSTKGEEGSSFGDGDTNTAPSVQSKETLQSKRRKKNKKSKIPKGTEADTEKVLPDEKVDSEVTQTTTKSAMAISDLDYLTAEQGMDKQTDSQSASDLTRPSVGDEANEVRTSVIHEDTSTESESLGVPESDSASESWGEGEHDVSESREIVAKKEGATSMTGKSSLIRQECLEHDQQIVALVSMVRHIEVRLKQQQQQSVGRSLIALDDIITQTETLDLELRDLEPAVTKQVEAAEELLKPRPKDVPPQLLLALEKDGRSLARGYEAARALSEGILQSLRDHRNSYKEAVTAEQKSLGGRVENLLSWLRETEAQMSGGMAGMDKMETAEKEDHSDQLTQQLHLCKASSVRSEELQASLTARSSEVNSTAFDIQVFISERAQDLAPEQSRQLLGQLQQLQRAFHLASGQAQAWADALSAQRGREEERRRRERVKEEEKDRERQSARDREVVQQQKAECSQKLEGLTMWLAGAASLLVGQKGGAESGDVNVLKEKQKKLKESQKDLQAKGEAVAEAIRSVEELLADRGESLSPEERKNLQGALTRLKEQYSTLKDSADTSLSELDTAISTTVQQNTQRAKAEEDLQETQGQIDSLLKELSSLNQPGGRGVGSGDMPDTSFSKPEGAVMSHTEMLQNELQQLQAQQAQLLQITQSTRALLDQPDSTVPPEEKQRLRAALDQLQAQHQERLQSCQDRLRKSESLKDELTKFLQEHGGLGTWLEQNEQELRSLGEGETDAQGLKGRLEEHRKLGEDVICHKADLRFVSISGQKVLDSVQGALEQVGGSDPALDSTKQLVTDKLQDANHRYTSLHTKSTELGGRLSGLLERYQQYQDEVVSLHSWLSTQEQHQSIAKPSGDTDPKNLQDTLRQVQLLQDELAEHSVQLEKVKRAGRDLVSTEESPSLKAVDILCAADGLEKRFGSLSASVSERAEQLQTAVAQSVSVQEGLTALLGWLDKLPLTPGPVEPTAQALQDALTQNQKLRQELLSRQGSVEATRDSISKLLQSSDASTASGLQGSLDQLTQRYAAAQGSQAESEAQLKRLLPRLESYERLGADLQVFTQSRLKALSPGGQPERSVDDYRQTIEEVKSELEQEAGQLKSFCNLGTDLSQSKAFNNTQSLLDNVKGVSDEFTQLEANVNQRFAALQACEQQLLQFRGLSGSLLRWLQTGQDQLAAKEANLNTESLQRRVQQLKDLLDDWESQGGRVQDLNKTGSELESLIIDITAPKTKTGLPHINGSAGPSSVNGIHTCKDLTELQVAVSDVNGRYEALGGDLKERLGRQEVSLELRQKARQGAEELKSWLTDRESSLRQGQTASPSKPEVVRAQAQENKALLSELAEHSGKVEELKSSLKKLIADNPDSPEADTWRQQLQEIDSRWQTANQTAAQRQTELETCADRLGSFASAASQLGPWLREKELMMSVLGPLSIDPNMLNTQKQQAQFMLREFDTRRPQFEQLTQSAEGILSQTGDSAQDPKDLAEVRSELGSISQQWEELTNRLTQRSNHIDQAQGTSEQYQALLRELSSSVSALGERLDGQASLSAQPEALKLRLQETGEIRSELERRRCELGEAERLCSELSSIVAEPYLKEELSKRLQSVSAPLRSLEERAADGLSQLQAALSSTQQFQQMFEELRSWLDKQSDPRASSPDSLPCQPQAIRSLLAQTDDLQRGIASQRGSYELLQAEGASLLASLPAGGEERSALQSRLASLKQDWDGMNQKIADRESRLKATLSKAVTYQQHKAELVPWLAECDGKDAEIQPSLDPAALDKALQKGRGLSLDIERRQPLLEAFNTAADQLLEQCCIGDEEVRDEKAQLNRRVDGLGERLHQRSSQLEELAGRLKEFEEGRQAAERRLEAAKHQIEVQEALGPQACSAKSLERLRSQQEGLRSLKPQVVYLRDLAQGLVQDAPQTLGGSTEGAKRLQEQARGTEKEYEDVTDKIEQCCSSLESRLQGVGEVQSHVRDVFSRIADLDDELDSLGPVGRDADSLASQADALKGYLSRLGDLRAELEGHNTDCTTMLRREGSSPDLLALRRETEALSRQAGKLSERGQGRLEQIDDAAEKVREFYRLVAELQGMLGRAENGLNSQGMVGTEVEMIKQQLQEFKTSGDHESRPPLCPPPPDPNPKG
ncbi:hypothetical protein NQZ68_039227 [Dissostichus eleginoides]|nr:hypothetical protein NQZ68_039227 [Dissostichus eleginoides]